MEVSELEARKRLMDIVLKELDKTYLSAEQKTAEIKEKTEKSAAAERPQWQELYKDGNDLLSKMAEDIEKLRKLRSLTEEAIRIEKTFNDTAKK